MSHNPQSFQELPFRKEEELELKVGVVSSTVLLNLFEIDTPVLITELQSPVSEISSIDITNLLETEMPEAMAIQTYVYKNQD